MQNLGLTYEDVGYIGALKGADGTCAYMSTKALNQVSCVLRSSKNAADAIHWIPLKVKEPLFICIGVEGTHFTYDEEGKIQPINPIFADERGDSYWYIDATDQPAYEQQWPSRIRKSDAQWAAFNAITLKANEETPEVFVDNAFAFKPASEAYTKYNTALFKSLQDFILQVISGTPPWTIWPPSCPTGPTAAARKSAPSSWPTWPARPDAPHDHLTASGRAERTRRGLNHRERGSHG
jgi:putative aldouronate transport system substrate-binding protein